jgi:hypothetical protein
MAAMIGRRVLWKLAGYWNDVLGGTFLTRPACLSTRVQNPKLQDKQHRGLQHRQHHKHPNHARQLNGDDIMRMFHLVLLALAASVSLSLAHAEEAPDGGDGVPPPEEFVDSGDAGSGDTGAVDTGTGDGSDGTTVVEPDGGGGVEADGGSVDGGSVDGGSVDGGSVDGDGTIGEPVYMITGGRPDDCPECRNLTTDMGTTRVEEPTPEVVESIMDGGDTGIDVIEPASARKRPAP